MLSHAQGQDEEALAELRQASDLEASMDKHPVTPGGIVPTYELLGDLLLQLNRPAQALTAYQQTLATDPNRLRSVYGAAKAAASAGDSAKQEHTTNSLSSWKAMQTVKPRKSRKRRLIWRNHRSVAAFVWCGIFADSPKSRAERIPRWRVPGQNRAWPTSSDSERDQLLLLPSGLLLGPSDGGDDSRDRNLPKSHPCRCRPSGNSGLLVATDRIPRDLQVRDPQ